jgi:hypothetical protein
MQRIPHPTYYTVWRTVSNQQHASTSTRTERGVQLIEEMKTHPHQQEILELARQQLQDMNNLDVVTYES